MLAVAPTQATSGGYSIGINFGADEPAASGESELTAAEVAGVPAVLQGNWNNVSGATGNQADLVADNRGAAATTTAAIEWSSAGSWASQGSRGENNNTFTGPDRKLMTGYLDTGNATTTRVTFTGLPTELTSSGYDVYVYTLGGVTGRGGTIRLEDANGGAIGDAKLVSSPTNPNTYVEDTGADHDAGGTYVLFTAVAGTSFSVVATTTENPLSGTPRAPVNAVQLVARTGDVLPVVRSAAGDACTFQLSIDDLGAAIVNPSSITVKLDGTAVTTQNAKNGANTTIRYDLLADKNTFFASGSEHSVEVSVRDTRNNLVTQTRTFTVAPYTTLAPTARTTTFDANSSGFSVRVHQLRTTRGAGDPNSIDNAEAQLAGRVLDAETGQTAENIADLSAATQGRFTTPTVNWEQNGGDIDANNPDNFNTVEPEASPKPNDPIPGQSAESSNDIAAEILTALELKRGCYVFGVNSDDGFLATVGHSRFGTVLGSFNGGRGAADTLFNVVVEQDGVYPVRLSWWEGGGGANVEFFSVDGATGEKVLINDRANTKGVKAYSSSSAPGGLTSAGPTQSINGVPRKPDVIATFSNGSTTVDQSSIRLLLDNQQVNATSTTSGSVITTRFSVPTEYAFGSTHTGLVVYTVGGASQTNTFVFTVRGESATDLAGGLAIEIEHFDHDSGQNVAAVNTMPYTGSEYDQLSAVHDVDYHQPGNEASNDTYRIEENPNVPMDSQLAAATLDVQRPGGWEVTQNYKIGWAGGDWYNFTRTFTNANYKIYAAQSHGDAAGLPNRLVATYGIVTSGKGTATQTTATIGSYSEPSTGGWGNNALVQVKNNGQPTVVRLSGTQTIRVWVESGDYDWFAFVPTTDPTSAPSVSSVSPGAGTGTFGDVPLSFTLNDFLLETTINTNSIKLTVNGADVTATSVIADTEGGATVTYNPSGGFAAGAQNYALTFRNSGGAETTFTGSFVSIRSANTFVIEAEDFNYDGGQTKAAASTMPLVSNLYTNLSATPEIDYHVVGDVQDAGATEYRIDESPNVPIAIANNATNRGSFNLTANYRIGWIDAGEWWNYTRTFPAGNYNVFAGISHGGGGPTSGSLQLVTGNAAAENQTVQQLGTFDAAGGTGGWGVNRIVPLMSNGALASVSLSGAQTIRYTAASGDYDFLLFAPAGGGGGDGPTLAITRSGANITVTWTEGTLESSTQVNTGWAPVAGATGGTHTTTAAGTRMFFRARKP
jgi:hypothetical protein